jgi:subtilase family serine protease
VPVTGNELNPTGVYSSQVYNYDGLQHLGHCCNPHNDAGGSPNVSNIAIAAFGNFLGSDVVGFQARYSYLAYNFQAHFIDGSIDCTSDPGDCPSGETAQDVEWTIATSNSFHSSSDTAKIFPYIAANYNLGTYTDMYGFMLSDNLARVFTTSWSCTEIYGCDKSTMDSRHNIFNSMVGQGWTLIAASGDRGSSDDCYFNKNSQTYNTAHF